MLRLLQVISNRLNLRQGLPPFAYTVAENLAGMSDRDFEMFVKTILHTTRRVVLLNCHYVPKYGEYVYWVKPVEEAFTDSEPFPVPVGYLV